HGQRGTNLPLSDLHRLGQLDIGVPLLSGPGHPASGRYIGALRVFARTLPESERVSLDHELAHYSAGALTSYESPTNPHLRIPGNNPAESPSMTVIAMD